ncbi:hypothetical protein HNY73_011880 [Argiope bruennichi]|uniref:Uncharacterized protein n=1 Tax=Argiope bruennichi TaxID=94029 RepID=A0A8T0EUR1_ARGBR|nr:hypothetical protein HNY73_011880 [Argiope bruennichi]
MPNKQEFKVLDFHCAICWRSGESPSSGVRHVGTGSAMSLLMALLAGPGGVRSRATLGIPSVPGMISSFFFENLFVDMVYLTGLAFITRAFLCIHVTGLSQNRRENRAKDRKSSMGNEILMAK